MSDWKSEIRTRLSAAQIEPAREAEIIDELAQHLEDRFQEHRAQGAGDVEARQMALAELNDVHQMIGELRETERREDLASVPLGVPRGANFLSGLFQDFRYGVRSLRKSPGFTLTVVLTLALGIGANTAAFTLINTFLLNPLPVRDASRLVAMETVDNNKAAGEGRLLPVSYLNLKDFEERNQVFTHLTGYTHPIPLTLSGGEKSERIFASLVTGNYFDTLGLRPVLGRFFGPEEDRVPGANPVAVVGYTAWQQRFGGTSDIIGRAIRLNNTVVTILGVAPEGFKGITAVFGPDLWLPATMAEQFLPRHRRWSSSAADVQTHNALRHRGELVFRAAGRLKPGVGTDQAEANVKAIAAALVQEYPELNQAHTVALRPLTQAAFGETTQAGFLGSIILMVVVGLVLLIACSNAANLLLARAASRRQEIAVRLALGASRYRLLRQLLAESTLLGLISGVIGLGIAYQGCELLWSFRPAEVENNFVDPKLDLNVLVFALLISLLTGLLFGIAPSVQSSRADVVETLKEETRTAGRSRRNVNFRNCLLVGQVALTLICLTTAALLLRSMQRAYAIDPGFQTDRLMIALTNPGQAGYDKPRMEQYYRDVRSRVSHIPGVTSVSWASNLPMFARLSRAISIEGQELRRQHESVRAIVNTVDLDYFATLDISITQGRDFTDADLPETVPVAIVNDMMARRNFPDQSPLGKRFRFAGDAVVREIIGVVKTANYTSLGEEPQACIFLPLRQNFSDSMVLYLETRGDPALMLNVLRRELRSIDPQLDVSDVRTGGKIIDQALFSSRMGVGLMSIIGLLALGLACIGLYGIVAYLVSQRQHEIGLRVALGATQVSVLRLVIGQGMKLVAVGIALGIIGAAFVGRGLRVLLFGLSPTDPISIFGAAFVLATVALLACYLPARRASRLDPLVALREA